MKVNAKNIIYECPECTQDLKVNFHTGNLICDNQKCKKHHNEYTRPLFELVSVKGEKK